MKLTLSIVLLAFAFSSSAQQRGEQTLERNLYYRALVATLDARSREAKFASGNDPLHQVIIQKDDQLNPGFPSFGSVMCRSNILLSTNFAIVTER